MRVHNHRVMHREFVSSKEGSLAITSPWSHRHRSLKKANIEPNGMISVFRRDCEEEESRLLVCRVP
jgi:hypothetical protein